MLPKKLVEEIRINPPEDDSLFWGFYDIEGKFMGGFIYRSTLKYFFSLNKKPVLSQVYFTNDRNIVDFVFKRLQIEEALIIEKLMCHVEK